mmetsp:Transcript_30187/g.53465  ORF Transcript_30187/g.53465 Transcript_30187/m.53465 type:complete len:282 (-) Transcript_30187:1541-2386(-)
MADSELSQTNTQALWKINDSRANKTGPHRSVYWVKRAEVDEEGKVKGEKWEQGSKYVGDWNKNMKEGFGVMYYPNGMKYEGQWLQNMRDGHGTLWAVAKVPGEKYRRVYTGQWVKDRKSGQGSYFYKNGDRYDGSWLSDKRHGDGRMLYVNGDIYEGQWMDDKRHGYGNFSKANGDYFEGYWQDDLKHGEGSYFFASLNKIYVGEWVEDIPKCGVYSEVDDEDVSKYARPQYFTDAYELPPIPGLELADPSSVLSGVIEQLRGEEMEDVPSRDQDESLSNS